MRHLIHLTLLLLVACGSPSAVPEDVGRYKFVEATEDHPSFILDTATGCLVAISNGLTSKEMQDLPELKGLGATDIMGPTRKSLVGFTDGSADSSCPVVKNLMTQKAAK